METFVIFWDFIVEEIALKIACNFGNHKKAIDHFPKLVSGHNTYVPEGTGYKFIICRANAVLMAKVSGLASLTLE